MGSNNLSDMLRKIHTRFWFRLSLAFLAGIVMFFFVLIVRNGAFDSNAMTLAVLAALMCVAFIVPIIAEEKICLSYMAVGAVLCAALVYLRICMFYFESSDYTTFLHEWILQMQGMSLPEAMRADIGDYNMPYLYVLFIISRIKAPDLYLIKFFSCLFDALAAFFVMKIVGHFRTGSHIKIISYLTALALPTVWLNGAFWGQCDVVFASLCLGMVYAMLEKRGGLAMVFWTLAFAFKLQAIFALPILIVGLFAKRIKPLCLTLIIPTFLATLLPAIICGRPIIDCLRIYIDQANQYPQMHLNIPSIWVFLGEVNVEQFISAAVFLAGCGVGVFLLLCYHYKKSIDSRVLISLFFLSALLLPYLLPRMHDRYFFLADLAALLVFFVDFKKWYVPIITVLASYSCYRCFVMGGELLLDHKLFAIAILVMLTIVIKETFEGCAKKLSKKND